MTLGAGDPKTKGKQMKLNSILIVSLAMAESYGMWSVGERFYAADSRTGSLVHHSGCMPKGRRRAKTRRRKMGTISQKKIRIARRRLHAAGDRHAFTA